jgi:hypothetical protein
MKTKILGVTGLFVVLMAGNNLAAEERFVDTGENIIEDTETGLMWTQDTNLGSVPSEEAQEFADNFTLSGYIDWRAASESEVNELVQGLYQWEAHGLFHDIFYDYGLCGNEVSSVFLENGGSGFQYGICSGDKSRFIVQHVDELPERPGTTSIWLVRQGPHGPKRYTQAEVDAMVEDAYKHGLRDSGKDTLDFEAGRQACIDDPASCGIRVGSGEVCTDSEIATFTSTDGQLLIPLVDVQTVDAFGGTFVTKYSSVEMSIVPECGPFSFKVTGATPVE